MVNAPNKVVKVPFKPFAGNNLWWKQTKKMNWNFKIFFENILIHCNNKSSCITTNSSGIDSTRRLICYILGNTSWIIITTWNKNKTKKKKKLNFNFLSRCSSQKINVFFYCYKPNAVKALFNFGYSSAANASIWKMRFAKKRIKKMEPKKKIKFINKNYFNNWNYWKKINVWLFLKMFFSY